MRDSVFYAIHVLHQATRTSSEHGQPMSDYLIDIKDLSEQLKIPPKTIRNKLSNGTWPIPPIRIGRALRWRQSDVDRLVMGKGSEGQS